MVVRSLTWLWRRTASREFGRRPFPAAFGLRPGDGFVNELRRIPSWLHIRPEGRKLLALMSGERI